MVKYLTTKPKSHQPMSRDSVILQPEPFSDAKIEATVFLGLLRHNEDQLVERAKRLLKKDREFFRKAFSTKVDEWTPMHACTLRGARKLVKLALKAGVDANLEMGVPEGLPGHCSLLHLAAHRGDVSLVELLVQNGAQVNKQNDSNCSPLFYALQRGNTLAAKKLLRLGADYSELSREERIYYGEDYRRKRAGLLCIPVRVGSLRNKTTRSSSGPRQTMSTSKQ